MGRIQDEELGGSCDSFFVLRQNFVTIRKAVVSVMIADEKIIERMYRSGKNAFNSDKIR